jgi:hypothetical protein
VFLHNAFFTGSLLFGSPSLSAAFFSWQSGADSLKASTAAGSHIAFSATCEPEG